VDYYASEIDKIAIEISDKNYFSIRLGDVRSVGFIPKVDLLIGGSPCQDLSIAKHGRKGLDGDRSGLFWEYVRILKLLNPRYFILENVNSMPKADRDIITREMGVEPVMIDASLVSAQSRKRLFWTNIPIVGLPVDRGIRVKDILEPDGEEDERMTTADGKAYCLKARYSGATEKHSVETKQSTMVKFTPSKGKSKGAVKVGFIGDGEQNGQGGQAHRVYSPDGKTPTLGSSGGGLIQVGHIGNSNGQANRVYDPEGKSVCLSANGGGLGAKTGLYKIGRDVGRRLNEDGHRADHDKSIPIERRIETREDDKSGTLTSVMKDNVVVNTETTKIRKLTPVECERLQGLPDNYTEGVATTHRYKCLGNAFNVDVIAFILSFIPKVQVEV
jgi:DNA (cytosine-5)-methyltransferase 3A